MSIEPYFETVPFISGICFSIITFFLNYLLLLFFVAWLQQQFNLNFLFDHAHLVIIVTACSLSSIVLLSGKILKRLSRRWEYNRFRNLQFISIITSWGILGFLFTLSVIVRFYELPLWASLLTIVLMDLYFYLIFFQRFISTLGEAILSFKTFLIKVETDMDSVNFKDLVFSLKKVNKIAKKYNMCISPKSLALAITTSFFKNRQRTIEEINEVVNWLRNPRINNNFNNFCNIIDRYNKDSKACEKGGLMNYSDWTFERLIKILGIVVPLISAILAIVIPIIIQRPTP